MKIKRTQNLQVIRTLALSFVLCSTLLAEEGGAGHYMPGGAGTLIDTPPTKAGWVIAPIYMHYSGEASLSGAFPRAGLVTAGL